MMKDKKMEVDCPKRLYCAHKECSGRGAGVDCFLEPNCEQCPVNTHCANRDLSGVKFELVKGSFTPKCFQGFHSTK